ncbi:DUF3347 domain-containing protein [Fibrivirga algicola]|jgi:hypothetical protein|uniref:DUF3347 domain-containing protein n=1 Tax=Fibrivirga algicola TaxID=2950420 RepID=A0ABX0QRR1_9BACT|nr:DUF3347 domain-containing protein [Fibrivirga algicola]NID13562.1 DUF3347 domain-containing protein [Fibrivirga algicola]
MKTIRLTIAAVTLSLSSFIASAQTTAPALTAYYNVKDALVSTDAAKAKTSAAELVAALGQVNAANLSATDKKAMATAKTKAADISKSTDVDVQREAFEGLSTSMIALAKATKPAKTYVQYCPMAAEGKGASWLSDKREVRNPYYGDKMLKCGSVKEEI